MAFVTETALIGFLHPTGFRINTGAWFLHKLGVSCVTHLILMTIFDNLILLLIPRTARTVRHAGVNYHAGVDNDMVEGK